MQPGYGAPPQAGYGAAPGPGGGGPIQPGGGGPLGKIRSPVMLVLVGYMCCPYYSLYQLALVESELNAYLGKPAGMNWLWLLFPLLPLLSMGKLVGEVRAKAGTPTQGEGSLIMYWLLGFYTIPKDVNEIWEHLGVRPSLVGRFLPT
jgi:hypothetical protein